MTSRQTMPLLARCLRYVAVCPFGEGVLRDYDAFDYACVKDDGQLVAARDAAGYSDRLRTRFEALGDQIECLITTHTQHVLEQSFSGLTIETILALSGTNPDRPVSWANMPQPESFMAMWYVREREVETKTKREKGERDKDKDKDRETAPRDSETERPRDRETERQRDREAYTVKRQRNERV